MPPFCCIFPPISVRTAAISSDQPNSASDGRSAADRFEPRVVVGQMHHLQVADSEGHRRYRRDVEAKLPQ
jgi:hypothetical protein